MSFARSTKGWPPRSVTVIDDVLRAPRRAREWALSQSFYEPEDITGWRSEDARVFAGLRRALGRHFGSAVRFLDPDRYYPSGVAYLAFSRGARREPPRVHWDEPESAYVAIVYLTPDLPPHCGTSLWRHKRTGLSRAPVRADEPRLGMSCEEVAARMERDSAYRSRWIEVDRIGHRFNRAVVYPAYALHSATRHHGRSERDGRVYLLYAFRR